MPSPSLAQMAMELHSNIPMLPFAKILYLVLIDVPTPTPTKVSKPLLAKVLVAPSIEHSYDILGARMLWKSKEARILKNFIDQPVQFGKHSWVKNVMTRC